MCAPAIGLALSLTMGIAQSVVQYQAARSDYAAKTAAWQQNIVNAQAGARDEFRQVTQRNLQEQGKTTQKLQLSYMEDAQKQALAKVSAAGAGVSGISVDNILGDISGKTALNRTYIQENYRYVAADLQTQANNAVTRQSMRIAAVPAPQEPSPLVPLIGIGTAGTNFMTGWEKMGYNSNNA